MNDNTLIEDIFPLQHPLMKRLFNDEILNHKESAYGQAVFIGYDDPKVIAAKIVCHANSEMNYDSSRVDILLKYGSDYKSCLIIATFLYSQSLVQIRSLLTSPNQIEDIFDHIIGSTNGFILFDYQFEEIARMILDVPLETVIALRKAFNRHKPLNEYCGVDDKKLIQFQRVLDKYLPFDIVQTPNYSGATNLLTYVNGLAQ